MLGTYIMRNCVHGNHIALHQKTFKYNYVATMLSKVQLN